MTVCQFCCLTKKLASRNFYRLTFIVWYINLFDFLKLCEIYSHRGGLINNVSFSRIITL